jgi:protein-disulfide isomerase
MSDRTESPDEDTITFKRSHFYSVLVVLAFAVGILFDRALLQWTQARTPAQNTGQTTAQNTVPQGPVAEAPVTQQPEYVRYEIPTDGLPSLGPDDAPITIVEFSDFQCPFCRRFHEETYQALLDAYPGQIRFVYRHLPLTSIHPDAYPSAVASMCAHDQGAFWPYHDKLFGSELLGREVYLQYAGQLELDLTAFEACLDSDQHDAAIQADSDFALNLGVNSTPTFFINGLAVIGAQPFQVFQQVIDKELAGEIPQ